MVATPRSTGGPASPKRFPQVTLLLGREQNAAVLLRCADPRLVLRYAADDPRGPAVETALRTWYSRVHAWKSQSPAEEFGPPRVEANGHDVPLGRRFARLKTPEAAVRAVLAVMTVKPPTKPLVQQEDLARRYVGCKWLERGTPTTRELVPWAMGGGKTKGALHVFTVTPAPRVTILCSNTLIGQWAGVIEKEAQVRGETRFTVLGYTEFGRRAGENPAVVRREVVVVDESHNYRNLTRAMQYDIAAVTQSPHVFLLTGTVYVNDACDFWGSVGRFFGANDDASVPPTPRRVREILGSHVSWYDPRTDGDARVLSRYPEVTEEVHRAPMGWLQALEYIMNARSTLTFGPLELRSAVRNAYNVCTRTASNMPRRGARLGDGCKVARVAEHLLRLAGETAARTANGRPCQQVVYSEFLDRGTVPLGALLQAHAAEFLPAPANGGGGGGRLGVRAVTGSTPEGERDRAVADFNRGRVDCLLISNAANEGVDMTGVPRAVDGVTVAHFHLLEPGRNLQTENQTKNRMVRFGCAYDEVRVHKYMAVFPTGRPDEAEAAAVRDAFWNEYVPPALRSLRRDAGFDPVDELARLLASEDGGSGRSVDERIEANNRRKDAAIQPLIAVLQECGRIPLLEERRAEARRREETKKAAAAEKVAKREAREQARKKRAQAKRARDVARARAQAENTRRRDEKQRVKEERIAARQQAREEKERHKAARAAAREASKRQRSVSKSGRGGRAPKRSRTGGGRATSESTS